MSEPLLIAVDGGNSNTDLALLRADGEVLALVRGPLSSPHRLGLEGAVDLLDRLLEQAVDLAGVPAGRPVARVGAYQLAGIDSPDEETRFLQATAGRGFAERVLVGNDVFALLRAGSESGFGIAVVCGAGINCVGVAPDGRHARFPALGPISGDWGGGYDVGLAAITAAARSEDGRGPRTALEHAVPAFFGLETPMELAQALHAGRIARSRIGELAPVVLAAARDDAAAAAIVDRLAAEIVALTRVALERLELLGEAVEVILGGGVLAAKDGGLLAAIEAGLHELSPGLMPRVISTPPIVGAALLALDAEGADEPAKQRARRELDVRREPAGTVHGG